MTRRALPFLLLPLLLAGRPVGIAHCHAGHEADARHARPHVHLGEPHRHCCGSSADRELSRVDPASDHDDDAVYVSNEPAVVTRTKSTLQGNDVPLALFSVIHDAGESIASCLVLAHPPPIGAADTPLFIRHLALLI